MFALAPAQDLAIVETKLFSAAAKALSAALLTYSLRRDERDFAILGYRPGAGLFGFNEAA
jgi:hypothetical protein